jgi:hypothetical protein
VVTNESSDGRDPILVQAHARCGRVRFPLAGNAVVFVRSLSDVVKQGCDVQGSEVGRLGRRAGGDLVVRYRSGHLRNGEERVRVHRVAVVRVVLGPSPDRAELGQQDAPPSDVIEQLEGQRGPRRL